MKIDKETIMLFGGGLLAGYIICKFTSKSSAPMSEPAPQSDAPMEFGADGLITRVKKIINPPEPPNDRNPYIGF